MRMDPFWQQTVVGVIVGGALFYLVRRSKKSGCEKGDCGCSAKKAAQNIGSDAERPASK